MAPTSLTIRPVAAGDWPGNENAPIPPPAMPPEPRWQQRFANFCQALDQLETLFPAPGAQ